VIELTRTNDLVLLSFLEALLLDAGIEPILLDMHTSAMEGSVVAIRRRLMVSEEDADRARRVLAESGVDFEAPP
jgi:hypothetical protein